MKNINSVIAILYRTHTQRTFSSLATFPPKGREHSALHSGLALTANHDSSDMYKTPVL